MKKKELQKLAEKVQLEIKEEEISTYLKTFEFLEKLLVDFKKVQIGKKIKPMTRINVGSLSLKDLEKLKKKFSQSRISKKERERNSLSTTDDFILFVK
jgi:Asp-tRNA(Asn)/Glu-tRNA(Gln) amidotransferase C subunit